MRIKVDEDLPKAAVQLLRRHGHDAIGGVQQGMGGSVELLEQALKAFDIEALVGTTAVVTPRGIRIRRTRA